MHVTGKYRFSNQVARLASLLAAAAGSVVQAADKAQAASPVGFAREAMGGGFMVQFFAGLVLVLVCVVALAWMMRRFGRLQSSANGALRVVDGIALSTRERLMLVQVGDTQILLGVAPGRVEAVHVLDQPVEEARQELPAAGSFAARFREVLGKEQAS